MKHFVQYAKYIIFVVLNVKSFLILIFFVVKHSKDDIWSIKFLHLQESHLLIQSLQPGSWSIYFNGFILDGSARTIRSLKLGNLLYEQKTESLGNISTTLALSVIIGRCFLIIELMLGPSRFYCVVNITGFILLFALFCWTVDLGWFLIFSKALIISFGLWLRAVK